MYNVSNDKIFQTIINLGVSVTNKLVTNEDVGFDLDTLYDIKDVGNITLICKVGVMKVYAQLCNVNANGNVYHFACHYVLGSGQTLSCTNKLIEFKKTNGKYYMSIVTEE